ncbi:MAG: bifunctional phosphoglucose/phosphomannose isomerase [Candidatus Omnitrophota bacterium]
MKQKLNITDLKKIDQHNMLDLLLGFPRQCRQAFDIAKKINLSQNYKDFKNIVFCGMGGSAIGADLVKSYLYFKSNVSITVVREYNLPSFVDENTLVFVSSYSGDTEETLSAYDEALKKRCKIIAISSGGKLKEKTFKDGFYFIEIPQGLPPRSSLGFLSIIPLGVLAKLMNLSIEKEIEEIIFLLEDLTNNLNPRISREKNIAKKIALDIYDKFVVSYSASIHFDVVSMRFRGQLAENSKTLSSTHFFPEMNHNEIVGWANPKKLLKKFIVVLFRDKLDHPRTQKRMEITKTIFKKKNLKVIEIWSRGDSLLARIFSLIYIGDFISFYLAILNKVDPMPVERVAYLKEELRKES